MSILELFREELTALIQGLIEALKAYVALLLVLGIAMACSISLVLAAAALAMGYIK